MTSDDLPGFSEAFRSLTRVFPLRLEPGDLDRLVGDYFRMLRRFALVDVKAGADAWLAKGAKFPKPAEWISAIPARDRTGDLRQMTDTEARAYRRAEALAWEDQPCLCSECVRAGVDHKPLRFVPEFDGDDVQIRVVDPIGKRTVIAGHWAHGQELFRYYDAKATFFAQCIERFGLRPETLMRHVGDEKPRPAVVAKKMKQLLETL